MTSHTYDLNLAITTEYSAIVYDEKLKRIEIGRKNNCNIFMLFAENKRKGVFTSDTIGCISVREVCTDVYNIQKAFRQSQLLLQRLVQTHFLNSCV